LHRKMWPRLRMRRRPSSRSLPSGFVGEVGMARRRPTRRDGLGLRYVHCWDCAYKGLPGGLLEVAKDVNGRLHVICSRHNIELLVVVIDDLEWPPLAPEQRRARCAADPRATRSGPGRVLRLPTAKRQ